MEYFVLALIILVGLYLLILITNLIFVWAFTSIMKKHARTLAIILNAHYDNIARLVSMLEEKKLEADKEVLKAYYAFKMEDIKQIGSPAYLKAKNDLAFIRDSLLNSCDQFKEMKDDEEYLQIKESLNELSMNYRSCVIMYNADVLGYNYWIRFLPCRYIFLMFKTKTKDLII